jgi:ribulose-5-phosphate 4-epimerase/fuculose-1-phosphate aldolase
MRKDEFLSAYGSPLGDFAALSRRAGARADYVQGGGGNTSVKLDEQLMAIKASGFCLSDIGPDIAYAVLDYAAIRGFFTGNEPEAFLDIEQAGAAAVKRATAQIEGLAALRPSVEAGFHSLLDRFVLHSHSVYANLAACAEEGKALAAQAFDGADYGWGFVPYVDPGARLTFAVRDELVRAAGDGRKPAVLLMQNHGVIVHHADAQRCEEIHADANERLAALFGVTGDAFPAVRVRPQGDGTWVSDTPFLARQLAGGAYSEDFLLRQPLYPDQLVFLSGSFRIGGAPAPGQCCADPDSGFVTYRMEERQALVIEETLTAVTFIASTIQRAGYTVSVMGEAAKDFIANWESEQYRKSLAAKQQATESR